VHNHRAGAVLHITAAGPKTPAKEVPVAKATDQHTTTAWSFDEAFRYLIRAREKRDGVALYELEHTGVLPGRLPVKVEHYLNGEFQGAGEVKPSFWRDHLGLEIVDGRAQVVARRALEPGEYRYTVSERDVRQLWPVSEVSTETTAGVESPARRRGPVLKHDWHAIDGEIALRCHDKSRQISVPKNESKLAADMLQWCVDTGRPQPADSEMRDAVKAICAALRKQI
jgi:hypothetical protein